MDGAAWLVKAAKLYFQLVDMCAARFRRTPAVGIKVTGPGAIFGISLTRSSYSCILLSDRAGGLHVCVCHGER